jgi:hypothetical protein
MMYVYFHGSARCNKLPQANPAAIFFAKQTGAYTRGRFWLANGV